MRLAYECQLSSDNDLVVGRFAEDQTRFQFLDLTPSPEAEAVIVLSRHESSSGRKTLSVHFTGNPTGAADFGGRPKELSLAPAHLAKALLINYFSAAEELSLLNEYSLTFEATHHGPTGNAKPLVFIEVGSTEAEWNDARAIKALSNAVIGALASKQTECEVAIGIGCTHYPAKFTRIELSSQVCFGHILSKHVINEVSFDVLKQAVDKSLPGGARRAFIDKGSLRSGVRKQVAEALAQLRVETTYV